MSEISLCGATRCDSDNNWVLIEIKGDLHLLN